MKKQTFGVAAFALCFAATHAVAATDLTGTTAIDDRLTDIETAVSDDMAKSQDASRFSNPEFRPGLSGSASLSYSGATGNTVESDLSAGARLRYASGKFVHSLGMALEYGETSGVVTKQDVFGVYDGNYYINDSLYGFVLGRVETDGLATTAADTRQDAFIGIGPGYRIINTPNVTWRMQAGVGASYLEDGVGTKTQETGAIVSSRLYYAFNDKVFATNDTDVLKTKSSLRVNNDFGINLKVTDALATRVSYMTEYNDSRAIQADNKIGLSVVFGF